MPEIIRTNYLDDAQSVFFGRELEHIKTKTYERLYPEYKAMRLIPVSNEAGPAAESITYRMYDGVGMAKILANYGQDLPRVDILGNEYTSVVRGLGTSYGYSIQEIRAAQALGRKLSEGKAAQARKAIEAKIDEIAWDGDAAYGIQGFLTNDNYNEYTVPDADAVASPLWSNKTATERYRDMADIVAASKIATGGVEIINTLLLPITQHELVASTPYSANSDLTILEYFKRNHPGVTVEWVGSLATAGAGSTARMIAYNRNPDKITLEIPQMFEQFPAQQSGLEFVVPCHARIGGIICPYPMSVTFGDGI